MADGVEVQVDDGVATIDFVDPAARGTGLAALLEHAPAAQVETLTRGGPRTRYRVAEEHARAAGLLTKKTRVDELEVADTDSATDATGAVPPEAPSAENLFSETVIVSGRGDDIRRLDPGSTVSFRAVDSPAYDDGLPDMDWNRKALDEYAASLTPAVAAADLPNKRAVLDAIAAAVAAGAKRP